MQFIFLHPKTETDDFLSLEFLFIYFFRFIRKICYIFLYKKTRGLVVNLANGIFQLVKNVRDNKKSKSTCPTKTLGAFIE